MMVSSFRVTMVSKLLLIVIVVSPSYAFTLFTPSSIARSQVQYRILSTKATSGDNNNDQESSNWQVTNSNRREWIQSVVGNGLISLAILSNNPHVALASGGATAGKYTTIPIAKRRYYGRVQQAVHEFLLMGSDVVQGDMNSPSIQGFFDPTGALIIPSKRIPDPATCVKKADGTCKGNEVRDSRYNDMKTSMYLLGNAFRTDQQKPPDRLPTVRAAKAFFQQMDEMEKRVRVKKPKTLDKDAQQYYVTAYGILEAYLDLVELPPLDSGHYDQEFDTMVGETARIT